MTSILLRRVLFGVIALVIALGPACAQGPAQDTSLVISSDPELAEQVAALLPGLADRSGLSLEDPVRVERRERAELERYLDHRLEEELPETEARDIVQSYALLGLVPEDLDLREVLLSVYTEQVAGFYDPDSTALFVMADQPVEGLEAVLVHELVHAVQDQHFPLDSLTAKERGNDGRAAAQAAIEGHATLVMLEYMTEQLQGSPVDLADLPDFASTIRPALAAMMDVYPILSGAPRVIRESLLFPYIEGAGYAQALWRSVDGRAAPFGDFLPLSTRQVVDPPPSFSDDPRVPLDVSVTPPSGSRTVYENDLGWLETGILLEEHGGAKEAAAGWRGDRFALFEMPDGSRGLVWASVWIDGDSRRRFVEALRPALSGLPVTATLDAVEIDGEPGAMLRIGPADGASAMISRGGRR